MQYLQRLSHYLLVLGVPGLFLVSLLDAAAVPLVGGPDGFVMLLAWREPAHSAWIVLAAALGSTLGCTILYRIGRAGGGLALSRLSQTKQARIKRQVENNAFLAVFLGVVAPPPFPTKPIILAAGIFRTPWITFCSAVLIGRILRYGFMAYLGSRFGDQAARVIRSRYPLILATMTGLVLLILLVRRLLRSRTADYNP